MFPKVYRGVEELVASSGSYPEDRGFKSHPRYEFAKDVCPTNLAFWFFTIFSTNQKKMDFEKFVWLFRLVLIAEHGHIRWYNR